MVTHFKGSDQKFALKSTAQEVYFEEEDGTFSWETVDWEAVHGQIFGFYYQETTGSGFSDSDDVEYSSFGLLVEEDPCFPNLESSISTTKGVVNTDIKQMFLTTDLAEYQSKCQSRGISLTSGGLYMTVESDDPALTIVDGFL